MIYLASDLHLEHHDLTMVDVFIKLIKKRCENNSELILAGDICSVVSDNFEYFFRGIQDKFKKIYFIMGNHEYYGSSIKEANIIVTETFDNLNKKNNNIIFLNNSCYETEDKVIIGSTLWSDLSYNNNDITKCKYMINDFRYINDMTVHTYQKLHIESVEQIKKLINDNIHNNKKLIVVTHHLPLYKLIDECYKYYTMNMCFASDLEDISNVDIWLYGHTHKSNDTIINNTRYVCNPIGYKNENKKFVIVKKINL